MTESITYISVVHISNKSRTQTVQFVSQKFWKAHQDNARHYALSQFNTGG